MLLPGSLPASSCSSSLGAAGEESGDALGVSSSEGSEIFSGILSGSDTPAYSEWVCYFFTWAASNKSVTQTNSKPVYQPFKQPTTGPAYQPFRQPTTGPAYQLFKQPTTKPAYQPSKQPTTEPAYQPSKQPTIEPGNHSSEPLPDTNILKWCKCEYLWHLDKQSSRDIIVSLYFSQSHNSGWPHLVDTIFSQSRKK